MVVVLIAAVIFLSAIVSPPSLMDDVDAFQAQMARNMYVTGDWVTVHMDGVLYFDKAPFKYWVTAILYSVLGVHDWVARIPSALSAILLVLVVHRFGRWAIGREAGFYAGIVMSTCIGLFLFTRIIIPDVMLTLVMAVALWAFLRAQDEDEPRQTSAERNGHGDYQKLFTDGAQGRRDSPAARRCGMLSGCHRDDFPCDDCHLQIRR